MLGWEASRPLLKKFMSKKIYKGFFRVLHNRQKGRIDFRNLMVALEVFRGISFDEKLKNIFGFCDLKGTGKVKFSLVVSLLKEICLNQNDREKLSRFSKGKILLGKLIF
jgi:Ca2+-binding EF-hand superfamily protein